MARQDGEFRYDKRTVAVWTVLGAVITVTSVFALRAGGVEALYLVVTGWIVGPFFILWVYRKIVGWARDK